MNSTMKTFALIKQLSVVTFLLIANAAFGACPASIDATKPDSYYLDNGDSTISDNKTGLMWRKCITGKSGTSCATGSATVMTWKEALEHVQSQNSAKALGYNDWRLPNAKEMASLIERQCENPAINTTVFPAAPSVTVWTSTPDATAATDAISVDLATGLDAGTNKTTDLAVWLVREN